MKNIVLLALLFVSTNAVAGDSYLSCSYFEKQVEIETTQVTSFFDRTIEAQAEINFDIPKTDKTIQVVLDFNPGKFAKYTIQINHTNPVKIRKSSVKTGPEHYYPVFVYSDSNAGTDVRCMLID